MEIICTKKTLLLSMLMCMMQLSTLQSSDAALRKMEQEAAQVKKAILQGSTHEPLYKIMQNADDLLQKIALLLEDAEARKKAADFASFLRMHTADCAGILERLAYIVGAIEDFSSNPDKAQSLFDNLNDFKVKIGKNLDTFRTQTSAFTNINDIHTLRNDGKIVRGLNVNLEPASHLTTAGKGIFKDIVISIKKIKEQLKMIIDIYADYFEAEYKKQNATSQASTQGAPAKKPSLFKRIFGK